MMEPEYADTEKPADDRLFLCRNNCINTEFFPIPKRPGFHRANEPENLIKSRSRQFRFRLLRFLKPEAGSPIY